VCARARAQNTHTLTGGACVVPKQGGLLAGSQEAAIILDTLCVGLNLFCVVVLGLYDFLLVQAMDTMGDVG